MTKIAILGYGTVGNGTAQVLLQNKERIEKRLGQSFDIKYILDLREFPNDPLGDKVVHDFSVIERDPEVTIVAEMLGGTHPAYDFTVAALRAGKSVVTSNKAVVECFGDELLRIATENGVRYLFEASVGGGIPIIAPLMHMLTTQNDITEISAILNGTTNYMLTKMRDEQLSYDEVLAQAQTLGYAEADPSADVDGADACRKICILAAIAFGKLIPMSCVKTVGIRNITHAHIEAAEAQGAHIRLIGRAVKLPDGRIHLSVEPYAVKASHPLHGVDDVFNAIAVRGDSVGEVMFYGRGAGMLPTASAVVGDIVSIMARGSSLLADERIVFERAPELYADTLPRELVEETEKTLGTPVFGA